MSTEQERKQRREYMREYRRRCSPPAQNDEPELDLVPSQCGYMAGYFDGEGCVHIQKSRRTDDGYNYRLLVRFSQTRPDVVNWIRSVFGGCLNVQRRNRKGYEEVYYSLTMASAKARRFLEAVRPYVVEKREQVELAFDFFAHTDKYKLRFIDHSQLRNPDVELAAKVRRERDEMYLRLREMKVLPNKAKRDGPVKYSGAPLRIAN